jgi:outer membrane lipoprotein-sorting protein
MMIAGVLATVAAGAAIAVAASGSGPVPPPKPLAQAIHDALGAPQVSGITARITFTNHLINASNLQGSDPILQGATGRLWLSSDHRLRLELQSNNGDAQAVLNNGAFWLYDPGSKTAYEGTLPASAGAKSGAKNTAKADTVPSIAQIKADLGRLAQHLSIGAAIPSDVAGQAAYTVRVSPKHDGGLLGAAELASDAVRGVPLRIAVYARGNAAPVLELKATNISYGAIPASDFSVSPPAGAKIVKVATPGAHGPMTAADKRAGKRGSRDAKVTGAAAVARALPFKLLSPSALVGLPRRSVTLLDWAGSPAALVSYGQNLGGVVVLEQAAHADKGPPKSPASGGDHSSGLSLPTVSINGLTGQELDTALGTMVRFTRAGVTYTVIGSVPAAAADAAARAL